MEQALKIITKVIKRNGEFDQFKLQKITDAIHKAGKATGEFGGEQAKKLTREVLSYAQKMLAGYDPTVEDIQDIVEGILMDSPYKRTAKAYVIYRYQHEKIREITSKSKIDLVDQYLKKADWQVKENSNMSYSLQGINNYISSEISKIYWLNKIYPKYIADSHTSGDLHLHDLGLLSVYCVGWDLHDLLTSGFTGVEGKIESGPAKHFRTALGQIVNFFYTLQGEAAGAQAFSNFDTLLAPFIYYDNLSYDEVKQAMQEFLFNINVPTRVGFQTPFTNITFDLNVPSYFKDQSVTIGGEYKDKTYGEFGKEMDMLNKAFLEVMLDGDAKGRVFTFPIPTYNITRDFDWDNQNLDLLWKMTAKYGIPYFANYVNSDMNPEDARSMCCRLRIDNRQLEKRGGGLFGSAPLTGSVGVVTVNLPRLGFKANNKEEFFELLDRQMDIAKESLEIKRKVLEQFSDDGLYPYTKYYLRDMKSRFGVYWKNHFSTIGLVGMNEATINLLGKGLHEKEAKDFGIEVMDHMRNRLLEFQEETGNNYNLEATPAEGTSYRLALLDQKHYPGITTAGDKTASTEATPYYTNSSQLPVNHTDDIFELLELQDELQTKYTGGTVVHLFLGEEVKNTTALKNFIRKVCTNYELPYFSITPTFSVCPKCGYQSGEVHDCTNCGSECEVYSRIVGYLRPIKQWNNGKKEEFKLRKNFSI